MGQVADLHSVVNQQRHSHDMGAVQYFADNAAANRVAIQADQQIEQRGAVADHNILFTVAGT